MLFSWSIFLVSYSGLLFYYFIFSILKKRGRFVKIIYSINWLRLLSAVVFINVFPKAIVDTFYFFILLTIILTVLEFYLLYKLIGSYLPPTILTITYLTALQTSFYFINKLSFVTTIEKHPIYFSYLPFTLMTQPLILLLLIGLMYILERKFNIFTALLRINKKFKTFSLAAIISYLLIFAINLFSYTSSNTILYVYSLLLMYIYLVFANILLVNYTKTLDQAADLQVKIRNALANQQKTDIANEFRHDFKAILLSLYNSLEHNNIPSAKEQLNAIISYSKPVIEPNIYNQLANLKLISLQGYFFDFFYQCEQNKVNTTFLVKKEIVTVGINPLDLIRCISILCNNALDSALSSAEKNITITITTNDTSLIFSVENSVDEKVDLKKIISKGYTTKQTHSGFGLAIFTKLLEGYRNSDYFFKMENNLFSVTFYVPIF